MKPFFPLFTIALAFVGSMLAVVAQPPIKKAYVEPKIEGSVVALCEDDPEPLFPLLTNAAGGEPGIATRENIDVYSGIHATRISGVQRYEPTLPGWSFKIVEKPQAVGEYRYVRFAWKKVGGTGIMVQFHDQLTSWSLRYVSGPNSTAWVATTVDEKAPAEWTVVTRDVFKDFQDRTITGIAFTAMDGSHGLFDHIYFGRTIDDLDARSKEVLGRVPPKFKLKEDEFKIHWDDLGSADFRKVTAAQRTLFQNSETVLPFIKTALKPALAVDTEKTKKEVLRLIKELDDDKFDVRETASKQLLKVGDAAREHLQAAIRTHESAEVVVRCETILKKLGGNDASFPKVNLRIVRIIRVLERANTLEAKAMLKEISTGSHDAVVKEYALKAQQRIAVGPAR